MSGGHVVAGSNPVASTIFMRVWRDFKEWMIFGSRWKPDNDINYLAFIAYM
jgi:hypothetical protein